MPDNTSPSTVATAPDLSLIICTLNEGEAIANVVTEICDTLKGLSFEIIVLDDDSADATQSEVLRLQSAYPMVRLHVRKGERGLSSAAIKGWDIARGRYLGVMDGDGQHDPKAILALAQMIMRGDKDLVCVSRYLGKSQTGLGFFRDLGSKAATFATGLVLKAPLTDPLSGCFMMTREWYVSARPKLTGVGFKILVDLVASTKIKPRFGEVKASLRQRQGGVSKLDLRVVLDLGALLVEKATGGLLPARFVLFAGVGVSGVMVNVLVLYLFQLTGYDTQNNFQLPYFVGILVSMTSNFFINNSITFRDKRLKGTALITGLLGFYLACAPGGVLNYFIAVWMKPELMIWLNPAAAFLLAGVIPAFLIGILNYWLSKILSWRMVKTGRLVKKA
jgi:dolichol-phosphate mannosyltransferase